MRNIFLTSCLASLASFSLAAAQDIPVAGVTFGQAEAEASAHIRNACQAVTRIDVADTRFPAASDTEVHLRCSDLTLANGASGGDAIFTFADDQLMLVDARGEANNFRPGPDPAFQIEGFDIYMPDQLVVHTAANRVSLFATFPGAPLALHWDNPAWTQDAITAPSGPFFLAPEIVFGTDRSAMTEILEESCELALGRPIETVWLATAPAEQFQIDCYGYEMAGYPRKFEFIFGDDTLQQVWLMFDTGDIPRIRAFLTAEYGAPIHVDEQYEIFDDYRLALRKDIPEIRYVSDEIAAIWAAEN